MAAKRLVVDTSVVVGDALRGRGRDRLRDERVELVIPAQMLGEVETELPRRVNAFAHHRRLTRAQAEVLLRVALATVEANTATVEQAAYGAAEEEARARCLRDPDDWPVVAAALLTGADIWTNDNDFLGVGVATWTTDTLQGWLDRNP